MAKVHKRKEQDARASLETAMARLHEDIYNINKQGKVNKYKSIIEGIETRKAKGATIRAQRNFSSRLGQRARKQLEHTKRQSGEEFH